MAKDIAELWQRGIRKAHQLDKRSQGLLGILVWAAKHAFNPDSTITAAAIAYFALFSLFPLILLSITITSFYLGPLLNQQQLLQKLEFIAPALGQLVGQNIDGIIKARGPVSIVAIGGLIWSASTIFYTLAQSLDGIWGDKRIRSFWKQKGLPFLFVLAFVGPVLILASFAGSLMGNLQTWLPEQILPIWVVTSIVVAILLDVAVFMIVYTLLPHGASTWREIIPGAIGAGLMWELAKKAFLLFVTYYISTSNLVYGSVAAIMAFLTWAYLSGFIFLFGAFLSVAFYRLKRQQHEATGQNSLQGDSTTIKY